MTGEFRMGYIQSVQERYLRATKQEKGRILDELCKMCRLNRKYAIWKIHRGGFERGVIKRKRHKDKLYRGRVLEVVLAVWKASGYPWSVRLQEIFRLWLPWIRARYRLPLEEQEKLLRISASTIDRWLRDKKTAMKRRLYGRTKPGTLLRHKIPLRTEFSDVHQAGWIEMDLVSHSGRSGEGEFLHTLNLTDIVSTWTESRAVLGKGERGIVDRLEEMRLGFPFPLRGLDVDNGSEFINYHVEKYCADRQVHFSRSRPYKKDDNAHIEQKNWTHVRKLIGWDRYDSPKAVQAMNDLYANELRLYMNLFQPSVKLVKVVRKGSRLRRVYDRPQTPLDRLTALSATDPLIHPQTIEALQHLRRQLDPFALSRIINLKLSNIWSLAHYRPQLPKKKTEPLKGISSVEKQVLRAVANLQGIRVYVRPQKGAPLLQVKHG